MSHECWDAEEAGYLEEANRELTALMTGYTAACCQNARDVAAVDRSLAKVREHLAAFEKELADARKRVQWSREP